MSECGQAHPEYIAPRDRNNWVKAMEHRPQEEKIHRTTKLFSDSSLQQILEMVCPGLSTREWPLPVKCGHRMARTRHTLIQPNNGKSEQDNVYKVNSLLSSISK